MSTCGTSHAEIDKARAFQTQQVALLNRVLNLQRQPITRASVSAITYKLWACRSEIAVDAGIGTLVTTGVFDKNASIFDTLQPWEVDSIGYNAKFEPTAAERTDAAWHRYEITISPLDGEPFPIVWAIETVPLCSEESA